LDISATESNKRSREESRDDLLALNIEMDDTGTLDGNFESRVVKQKRRRTVSRIVPKKSASAQDDEVVTK